ncbi:uncharacterized protein Z519_00794 [Cladophialophora bantiana CBS 173.52]|uniref:O-methyltransferase C-terminal domain-containing protein n=1 Tax=Cladophialophora bantiana (strain ATCC 10958 / CBS 173.52 / CDC B-1940 / NIH 8579) TaxID=1442370 RepID=A0A0D2FAI9_CLAB1|nr:uncharacterized protein Z519_00794 [Cladophialophora bantiana CBS 173.52]KIW99131.1 hypothetical protein Z519_00794 [Cladophialophora bantiana CBS 173.52]
MSNPNDASILGLARQIQTNASTISEYLRQNSLSSLSVAADAYPFFPGTGPTNGDRYPRLDEDIFDARTQLREACGTPLQLVLGSAEASLSLLLSHFMSACMQYIYHYRLAEGVPVAGDISYKDHAAKIGALEGQRVRSAEICNNPEYISAIKSGDMVGYATEESFLAALKLAEAVDKHPGSQEKNTMAWILGHNTDLPMFVSTSKGILRGYNEAFDWKALGDGLVADVGGSSGHCCFEVAEIAPELKFIVQDLEKVATQAQQERTSDKHAERVEFQTHNFFTPQLVKNADVYLLRFICHDYSGKYAAQILSNITPAMGPNSRIVIVDAVMPEVGVLSKADEIRARVLDIEMMLSFNGCERDESGWKALFEQADPRLELRSTKKIPGNIHGVMEVGLKKYLLHQS